MNWKVICSRALVVLAIGAMVSAAMAQGGGGGGRQGRGGMMQGRMGMGPGQLINRPEVQTELKLTDEQKRQIQDILNKAREDMQGLMENARASGGGPEEMQRMFLEHNQAITKKINAVLTPEQAKRLKEIGIQAQGIRAILDPEVQKELGLSADQKAQIQRAQQENQRAMMEAFQGQRGGGGGGNVDREAMREARDKMNKQFEEALTKVLTPEQAQKLKEMGGAPFKLAQRGGGGG